MCYYLSVIARDRNAATLRWAVKRRQEIGRKSRSTTRDRVGWGLIRVGLAFSKMHPVGWGLIHAGLAFIESAETRRGAVDSGYQHPITVESAALIQPEE